MSGPRPKDKLRILTNNVHTSYCVELARLGHDFFVELDLWDANLRPVRPENWRPASLKDWKERAFDLVLVNHDWNLAERYGAEFKCPMIFSVLADCSEGVFPDSIEERCEAVTFLGKEVHDRWELRNPLKKRILELGMDGDIFRIGDRSDPRILTVGCNIGKRWDKGHCPYVTVATFVPTLLVGPGNEGLPGSVGAVNHDKLLEFYSKCQIYFNPGPICGISMVEAMLAGMPVVTFRTINLVGLIQDGLNGFVVDTVDGAVNRLRQLQGDIGLRMTMGATARETALGRFSFEKWRRSWNYLFESVVGK